MLQELGRTIGTVNDALGGLGQMGILRHLISIMVLTEARPVKTYNTEILSDISSRISLQVAMNPATANVNLDVSLHPRTGASTDAVPRLQHENLAALAGKLAGGDSAGPASSDDDNIQDFGHDAADQHMYR